METPNRELRFCVTSGLLLALSCAVSRPVRADTVPQPLPFVQNWSNTALITVDDN